MIRFGEKYQIALILLGLVAAYFFGIFFYRELFPEYRIYQEDYVALEEFRSSYTGEPPPLFKYGVKQIVIEPEDKGPPIIDRCISCHVAIQIPDFSPTMIGSDVNGNIIYDEEGIPQQITNPNYVWTKLNEKIQELKESNPDLAARYEALKVAHVGEHTYNVEKVLQMHPLLGRETRPFEYHSIDELGCASCHNGNGRGLTTEKAHGPVFDGDYEIEFVGPVPEFLESDPAHDPRFSKVFNGKPGHNLLFQTTPIYVGSLIEAKCMQCHQSSSSAIQGITTSANLVIGQREKELQEAEKGFNLEKSNVLSLFKLRQSLLSEGLEGTVKTWETRSKDYTLPLAEQQQISAQLGYLRKENNPAKSIDERLIAALGSQELIDELSKNPDLNVFIKKYQNDSQAVGTLFSKAAAINLGRAILRHVQDVESSLSEVVSDQENISKIVTDVDRLTKHFHRGEQLYISQACYACHRISGFARGGVGPELTRSGDSYPWFVKESIVWPQADLKTSTMPNFRLDHDEVEDLVTYLLAQKGGSKAISETSYRSAMVAWEAGKKLPWEKPVTPVQIQDVRYGMTVFATEGCAGCHRLKGFESDVGFAIEKDKPTFDQLYEESEWFKNLIPENILGSQIVAALEKNQEELDQKIIDGVRKGSLLEEFNQKYPHTIESYYAPFKYAMRAHDDQEWKDRVRRIMMMYVQSYGLGRLIGPRPNWSGVMRTDEWLMEHFRNPAAHVPRSIMPVMPFDETKFYALTFMLDEVGKRNRDSLRDIWKNKGFNPALAFSLLCSQCHGDFRQGNGPVAEWIYPIPKNLQRADFLRNLTKTRVIQSITHGVKGTPMPPWGEIGQDKLHVDNIPVLTNTEIKQLTDWLFFTLPGGQVIQKEKDVPKWEYSPEDLIQELKNEGIEIPTSALFQNDGSQYLASLTPMPIPKQNQEKANEEVLTIFDVLPNPVSGAEQNAYFIKKKYYTPENLAKGQAFFVENCAVCHGREADGAGPRAEAMFEAKPRMLTNLDWLNTRDDLRLLRSIKYGVIGTAMTPWGDFTSALQRMQLVMFIRSLSEQQEKRLDLLSAIYKGFDTTDLLTQRARVQEYQNIEKVQKEYQEAKQEHQSLLNKLEDNQATSEEVLKSYQKVLLLQTQLSAYQNVDNLLNQLRQLIKKEKEQFQNIGLTLLSSTLSQESLQKLIQIIDLEEKRFSIENSHLKLIENPDQVVKRESLEKALIKDVEHALELRKQRKEILDGKIKSPEVQEEFKQVNADITNIEKFQRLLITNLEEAQRLRQQQKELLDSFQKILNTPKTPEK